ncbi:MAG: YceH family protein [Deinococcales bacterium]
MDFLPLTELEVRVLGTLMEKQVTTPDLYPLSLNSLTNACNQKNSRQPVSSYSEREVEGALETLRLKNLAGFVREPGGRVQKYQHYMARELYLKPDEHAVLCVLMLRGAQTVGELRGRCEPLHKFSDLGSVEAVLERFASREMVVRLERGAGERDHRWTHLLTGTPVLPNTSESPARTAGSSDVISRLEALEAEILALRAELEQVKNKL